MSRIAILGASGFLGATLVEHLMGDGRHEVLPVIHHPGNAWRIARHAVPIASTDVSDRTALTERLRGCDYVVNCTRGSKPVMLAGLGNILRACRAVGVRRLVHISSVTVFGDPPLAERETDPLPKMAIDTYGGLKQAQDRMVEKAAAGGLACSILVPPNISGPYSDYLLGIISAIRHRELALVDEGRSHCSLVAVENLCHAITLALDAGRTDGSRYFITDDAQITWADLVRDLSFVCPSAGLPALTRAEMERRARPPGGARVSAIRSLAHAFSTPVREALRRDPLWARLDKTLRAAVKPLGRAVESRLRKTISGPVQVAQRDHRPHLNVALSAQQLRTARPCIDRARSELDYQPLYSYEQSMQAFRRWYTSTHALDSEFRELLSQLSG